MASKTLVARPRMLAPVLLALFAQAVAGSGMLRADVALGKEEKLKLAGDFRFRLESDWDSQTPAGLEREDRNRARARVRLGLRWEPSSIVSLGARVRTGTEGSQQSPFITVLDSDDGAVSENDYFWDRWYLALRKGGAWTWMGRNSLPFWKQNEMVLDDDVTMAGVSGGYQATPGKNRFDLTAGYFTLPDGSTHINGNLAAGQVVYTLDEGRWGLTAAAGAYVFRGSPGSIDLLHGNGARDYAIWVGSVQGRIGAGRWPLVAGLDVIHNAQDYSRDDPDPFTAANHTRTDGYVLTAQVGRMKEKGDWLFLYHYVRLETLSVNSSYCQDDWVRWGNATQGDSADMKGHELRAGVGLGQGFSLVARLYVAEAITTVQDGKRFRLDLGYDF